MSGRFTGPEYESEKLALAASCEISELMESSGMSKADLAKAVGSSRAHITQLLSGRRNMTLKTLAELAFVLGARIAVTVERIERAEGRNNP